MKVKNKVLVQGIDQTRFIFFGALIITIYINSQLQDPFNSPKFWALLIFSSWLSGSLIKQGMSFTVIEGTYFKRLSLILVAYLVSMFISSLFSYNKNVAFLGESFRRNGFLTYVGFVIFFLTSAKFVRFENIVSGFRIVFFVGLITGVYSLIQITGHDWIKWSDKSSVITTLGNSNFSGAAMAIFSIIIFGQIFVNSVGKFYRASAALLSPFLILAIIKTNARQAELIMIFGFFLICLLFIYNYNALLSKTVGVLGAIVGLIAIFGTLQIGPLKDILYKESVTIRGYYWRAGYEMFIHHPIFGVGIDNYGFFFKQYREYSYPLKYGFAITSSNAHNVFIQNFATGGVFVGLLYFILQILVLLRGLKIVLNNQGEQKLISVILFAAWLAFQAQSLISIDNIGVSIWGWVLGGSIVGLSFSQGTILNQKKQKSLQINLPKILISSSTLMLSLFLVVPLYYGERATILQRIFANPGDASQKNNFMIYSQRVLNSKLINNDYKNLTLSNVANMGDANKAFTELKKIINNDYRNLDTLILLAQGYEQLGNYNEAIKYRLQIAKYDPWNAVNYLGLAQLYKVTGDRVSMIKMYDKIMSFASKDPIAEVAKKEFSSN